MLRNKTTLSLLFKGGAHRKEGGRAAEDYAGSLPRAEPIGKEGGRAAEDYAGSLPRAEPIGKEGGKPQKLEDEPDRSGMTLPSEGRAHRQGGRQSRRS
ncbi:MAG: hypothetical protein WAV47_12595 [Blastocatellia bacterium]